jgi:hypothetical protein
MLNCIIRLQAVVEMITNETARALNLLAKQSTKITMLAIKSSYLLVSEEGSLWKI